MIYTIDSGNRYSHVGVFFEDKLISVEELSNISLPDNKEIVIYSSVGDNLHLPGQDASDFFIDGHFLGMPVHYTQELGMDRAVLGRYFFKGNDTLPTIIVDAGTFITVDFVTSKGFMGGMILPGIDIYLDCFSKASRISALSKNDLSFTEDFSFPGQSTRSAISSGFQCSLEGILDKVCAICMPKNIYLTGGNGEMLQKFLPTSKFDPHFIHFSLKRILQLKEE